MDRSTYKNNNSKIAITFNIHSHIYDLSFHLTTTTTPINFTVLPTRSTLFLLAYNYTFNISASGRCSPTPSPCSRSVLDPNTRLIKS